MQTYRFITTDVFTRDRFGGNQLAVLSDARGLTTEQMQAITREFGYSESVFVLPPDASEHTARLRIFTPAEELPFAGHPTVGTAIVLAELAIVDLDDGGSARVTFEEGVSPIAVEITTEGEALRAELTAAAFPTEVEGVASREHLAQSLSIEPADFDPAREPKIYSCGVPFTFVPVRDRTVLSRIRLDREAFSSHIASSPAPLVFVFANDAEHGSHDIRARMFAPTLGVDEDPATGSAAAALNGYLAAGLDEGEHRWTIEQGYEMGRPSQIQITAVVSHGKVVEARVAGFAVTFAEGTLKI